MQYVHNQCMYDALSLCSICSYWMLFNATDRNAPYNRNRPRCSAFGPWQWNLVHDFQRWKGALSSANIFDLLANFVLWKGMSQFKTKSSEWPLCGITRVSPRLLHFPREVKLNTNYYISEIVTPLVIWLAGQVGVTDWRLQHLQREVKFDGFLSTCTGEMQEGNIDSVLQFLSSCRETVAWLYRNSTQWHSPNWHWIVDIVNKRAWWMIVFVVCIQFELI
jgi:hypothetical protein